MDAIKVSYQRITNRLGTIVKTVIVFEGKRLVLDGKLTRREALLCFASYPPHVWEPL